MLIKNPSTGKTHEVTRRAYELVYKRSGCVPVEEGDKDNGQQQGNQEQTPEGGSGAGGVSDTTESVNAVGGGRGAESSAGSGEAAKVGPVVGNDPEKLSADEVADMMESKKTVMAALKKYGQPFTDRTGVEGLRDQLREYLTAQRLVD